MQEAGEATSPPKNRQTDEAIRLLNNHSSPNLNLVEEDMPIGAVLTIQNSHSMSNLISARNTNLQAGYDDIQ